MSLRKGTEKQILVIPDVIEDKVEKSEDFGKVRRSIRRALFELFSCFPDQKDFDDRDMEEMENGRAPYASPEQAVDNWEKMQLHHQTPRHKEQNKTFANRLANLIGMSPKYHSEGKFLNNKEHYGEHYGNKKDEEEEERERKKRG